MFAIGALLLVALLVVPLWALAVALENRRVLRALAARVERLERQAALRGEAGYPSEMGPAVPPPAGRTSKSGPAASESIRILPPPPAGPPSRMGPPAPAA